MRSPASTPDTELVRQGQGPRSCSILATVIGDLVLIVGNGVSIDLRHFADPRLADWNTSSPLGWQVDHPEYARPLRELFPHMFDALHNCDPTLSDFAKMTEVVTGGAPRGADIAVIELRHYLVMAFSLYQREVERLDMRTWRWVEFLRLNRHHIAGIISFNYDLVVERAARTAGIRLCTLEPRERVKRVLDVAREHEAILWKPHGSIDYRPSSGSIYAGEPVYPLKNRIDLNNLGLEWCPEPDWTKPRVEADVVIPTEYSRYRTYQWVAPGEDWVRRAAPNLSACVIAGMGYEPYDRHEVDLVLESLPKSAKIVVANPVPPPALVHAIKGLGLAFVCVDGPAGIAAALGGRA
jgi:hypothetical protein